MASNGLLLYNEDVCKIPFYRSHPTALLRQTGYNKFRSQFVSLQVNHLKKNQNNLPFREENTKPSLPSEEE